MTSLPPKPRTLTPLSWGLGFQYKTGSEAQIYSSDMSPLSKMWIHLIFQVCLLCPCVQHLASGEYCHLVLVGFEGKYCFLKFFKCA